MLTAWGPGVGTAVIRIPTLCATLALVSASALQAQSPELDRQVGRAVLHACGELDPSHGVVAGIVRDRESQVALEGARVAIRWETEGEPYPSSDAVLADEQGFFLFCGVPGGVEAELTTEALGVAGEPRTVIVEAGALAVERFELELSDPSEPGYLTGQIVDIATGRGIASVQVRVKELDIGTISNEQGLFHLPAMPWGIYTLEADHIAYARRELPVRVAGGITHNLSIDLAEQAIELGGISVTVEPKRFYLDREGLISRMNLGFGDFYTRADMDRLGTGSVAELVGRGPGVRVYGNGTGLYIRGQPCIPLVFVDGTMWKLDDRLGLKDLSTFDADAIEFYKGTAAIPAEFNYSTNATGEVGCGALVIWTRRGR